MASRNYFQDREGCPRLGPVPGQDLARDQQAHRADRPRPAAHRRDPGRAHRNRSPASRAQPAPLPACEPVAGEPPADGPDLQFWTGTAPLPDHGGQPCPPHIAPIALSAAETGRIEKLARDSGKPASISRARLAFQLRWSAWRRRHQARARWHHYAARLAPAVT